jgi:hypothetical protein
MWSDRSTFERRHDNLLRDINDLEIPSELRTSWFRPASVLDAYGRDQVWENSQAAAIAIRIMTIARATRTCAGDACVGCGGDGGRFSTSVQKRPEPGRPTVIRRPRGENVYQNPRKPREMLAPLFEKLILAPGKSRNLLWKRRLKVFS